jgi:PAS domain S-box-containing protein
MSEDGTPAQLLRENKDLRARLAEAEETLSAIRCGGVDALVVPGTGGGQLFTRAESDQIYRLLVENMSEGALTITTDGVILYANRHLAGLLKAPLEKIIGSPCKNWMSTDNLRLLQGLLKGADSDRRRRDLVLTAADGTRVPTHVSVSNVETGGTLSGYCLLVADLTEQKRNAADNAAESAARRSLLSVIEDQQRTQEELRQAQQRMSDVLGTVDEVIWSADANTHEVLFINSAAETVYGRPVSDFFDTLSLWHKVVHPDDIAIADAMDRQLRSTGNAEAAFRILRPDGTTRWIRDRAWLVRGDDGKPLRVDGVVSDITAGKAAETDLLESESRFRTLAEQSLVGIYVLDGERIAYANPRIHEIFGQPPGTMMDINIREMISEEDLPRVADKVRQLMSGKVTRLRDEFTIKRGDGTTAIVGADGMRTRIDGKPVIIGMLQDITDKLRAEQDVRDYIARIERMITGTVAAMSSMVELRDPYTAGHERRVGDLSAAIAAEMGLDDRMQTGLRLAGAVHDVGKIAVPAEILVKPGRLSPTEYELIKSHAQQGYEVLRGIDSPWPIAEVARQHHERIDGSGYPRGLKGDDILLEARILAVADVVESMGSHRPYRAALGMDKALEEIERGAGTLFDPQVAAACIRLFREKNYRLPD